MNRFIPLLLLFANALFAQPTTPPSGPPTTPRIAAIAPVDTTPLAYTLPQTPERLEPERDTLPDYHFRIYNPARQQAVDYGTLGNLGSSARPLFFETLPQRGFDVGVHAFDIYNLRPNDLRFYRNARSYSDVFFSQGRSQQEGILSAQLARTFAGGTTFSLDYRTINNLGQFRHQLNKHLALVFGLWVPRGKRYEGFLIFSKNINRQQDNGGILTDTVFGSDQFRGPIAAEVRLPDDRATTRLAEQTLQLTQHLRFVGSADSRRRALRATHTFAWQQQQFKFYNQGIADDTVFFRNFLTDLRGLRHFIDLDRLDNTLALSTFKEKQAGRPSDVLTVGVAHSYFHLRQEPRDSTFSNLFLTGQLAITPSDKFRFVAQGALGVLANIGEYQINGELTLGLGRVGVLRASLLSQRRPPGLLYQQLFVSKRLVWQVNNLEKPVETTLSGTYALPSVGFEATARTHVVSNYLYFDQKSFPVQTTAPLQVAQLLVSENLHFGGFRFDNTIALQQSNRLGEVLRLPQWFSRNSLYYAGRLFKKNLYLTVGVDFRINSEFRPDAYQPLSWQFHLQDTLTQKPYPSLDVFAAFKVQSFRFFFRYENVRTLWDKTQVYYQTAYHPQPFGAIRLGIAWRFLDSNLPEAVPGAPPPGSGGTTPTTGPAPRQKF
ncbi:MAG: putative porin [Saprospiraceae bacterium]|nr:putative porin [Saprospiraceae bacterium]